MGQGLGLGLGLGLDQFHTSLFESVTEDEALLGLVLEAPAVLNWEAAVEHMSLAPVWQTSALSRRPAQPSADAAGSLETRGLSGGFSQRQMMPQAAGASGSLGQSAAWAALPRCRAAALAGLHDWIPAGLDEQ